MRSGFHRGGLHDQTRRTGSRPPRDGGYLAGRLPLIATLNVGKLNKAGQTPELIAVTFGGTIPGAGSYTCPPDYRGLQANTDDMVIVYAWNSVSWNRPLARRGFRAPKHPGANSYCG